MSFFRLTRLARLDKSNEETKSVGSLLTAADDVVVVVVVVGDDDEPDKLDMK